MEIWKYMYSTEEHIEKHSDKQSTQTVLYLHCMQESSSL